MDAALAALLEFEVLHRIGEIGLGTVDPGLPHGLVEELAGRSHEGPTLQVLLIARLLADEDDVGMDRAFAEHRLGGAGHQRPRLGDDRVELSQAFRLLIPHGLKSAFGGAFGRHRRLLFDHPVNAPDGGLDQAGNRCGLRHVVPVLLRHLGAHGGRVHPRRVEHALVIAAPALLEAVRIGRVLAPCGRAEAQRRAVPAHGADGGQDRPVHRAKPVDEERRRRFQDEMLRLEPGGEAFEAFMVHAAEAHEGVHLVQVAPHGARHEIEPMHQRIAGDLQQIALAVEHAPDEPVEQRIAFRIAVADHMLDEPGHALRNRHGRCIAGHIVTEQRRRIVDLEDHVLRRQLLRDQPPHGTAKGVEIGAGLQGDAVEIHAISLSSSRTPQAVRDRWTSVARVSPPSL